MLKVLVLRRNYYLVLGVSPNESCDAIRRAFRELASRYHPDRLGPARLHFFQEILDAYHVLADPQRRSHYDQGLYHAGVSAVAAAVSDFAEAGARDLPQPAQLLRAVAIKDAPFEAALARVSGTLTAGEAIAKREFAEGLHATVILSPAEAARGGAVLLAIPSCSPCERCGASGRQGLFPCSRCDGEGLLEEQETVRVYIPPNLADGTVMEIPLRGLGIHNFYLRLHIRIGGAV
jgi:molecular chaperone DnaJ